MARGVLVSVVLLALCAAAVALLPRRSEAPPAGAAPRARTTDAAPPSAAAPTTPARASAVVEDVCAVRVETEAGAPVAGAHVELRAGHASTEAPPAQECSAAADGTCRFALPLDTGPLEVRAVAPGHALSRWQPATEHAAPPRFRATVVLRQGATLRGVVHTRAGAPAAGALVGVGAGALWETPRTGADGGFALGLPAALLGDAAEAQAAATHPAYGASARRTWPLADLTAPVELVLSAVPAEVGGSFACPDGSPVAGLRVRLEATFAVELGAFEDLPEGAVYADQATVDTDARGAFVVRSLPPGAFHLGWDAADVGLPELLAASGRELPLLVQSRRRAHFVLPYLRRRVEVVGADGRPQPRAAVSVLRWAAGPDARAAETAWRRGAPWPEDRAASARHAATVDPRLALWLAPGDFWLASACAEGCGVVTEAGVASTGEPDGALRLVLPDSAAARRVRFALLDPDGAPVPAFHWRARPVLGARALDPVWRWSTTDGATAPLGPGTWRCELQPARAVGVTPRAFLPLEIDVVVPAAPGGDVVHGAGVARAAETTLLVQLHGVGARGAVCPTRLTLQLQPFVPGAGSLRPPILDTAGAPVTGLVPLRLREQVALPLGGPIAPGRYTLRLRAAPESRARPRIPELVRQVTLRAGEQRVAVDLVEQ